MASHKPGQGDDWDIEASWEDKKRRKRLGNRKKDSRPIDHIDGPTRGRKRMGKSFSESIDGADPRRSWRDSYSDDDIDADDIDLSDLDGDFEPDPDNDSDDDDLEVSDTDY